MLLVMVYAVGEYTGNYWLVIPQMAHLHGPLNGPGFVLLSLVAWVVETGPGSPKMGIDRFGEV